MFSVLGIYQWFREESLPCPASLEGRMVHSFGEHHSHCAVHNLHSGMRQPSGGRDPDFDCALGPANVVAGMPLHITP